MVTWSLIRKGIPLFERYRKAREDIEVKNLKLAQMEADYGDVVPRRDYEKLDQRFQLLQKDIQKLKKDHDTLMKEHK